MRLIDASPYENCKIVLNSEDPGLEVRKIRTIEADPVAHGYWEKYKHHKYMSEIYTTDFRCSVCKKRGFHNGEKLEEYKYCPHCGAKMDEVMTK